MVSHGREREREREREEREREESQKRSFSGRMGRHGRTGTTPSCNSLRFSGRVACLSPAGYCSMTWVTHNIVDQLYGIIKRAFQYVDQLEDLDAIVDALQSIMARLDISGATSTNSRSGFPVLCDTYHVHGKYSYCAMNECNFFVSRLLFRVLSSGMFVW